MYRKYCLLPVPKRHKNIYIIVTQPETKEKSIQLGHLATKLFYSDIIFIKKNIILNGFRILHKVIIIYYTDFLLSLLL